MLGFDLGRAYGVAVSSGVMNGAKGTGGGESWGHGRCVQSPWPPAHGGLVWKFSFPSRIELLHGNWTSVRETVGLVIILSQKLYGGPAVPQEWC